MYVAAESKQSVALYIVPRRVAIGMIRKSERLIVEIPWYLFIQTKHCRDHNIKRLIIFAMPIHHNNISTNRYTPFFTIVSFPREHYERYSQACQLVPQMKISPRSAIPTHVPSAKEGSKVPGERKRDKRKKMSEAMFVFADYQIALLSSNAFTLVSISLIRSFTRQTEISCVERPHNRIEQPITRSIGSIRFIRNIIHPHSDHETKHR